MDILSSLTIFAAGTKKDRLQLVADYAAFLGLIVIACDAGKAKQLPKVQRWLKGCSFKVRSLMFRHLVGTAESPVMVGVVAQFDGAPFPVEISIQGTSVSILILITSKESGKEYVLYVRQPRYALGIYTNELVAGREDGLDVNNIAIGELIDEAGLDRVLNMTKVQTAQHLKGLIEWHGGIWSSTGATNEFVKVGILRLTVSQNTISRMNGQASGDAHEKGMTTQVVEYEKLLGTLTGDPRAYYIWAVMHGAPEYHPEFESKEA